MFRTVLTADIGTSNIRFGFRDRTVTEENCAAFENGQEFNIAWGSEAAHLRSGTVIHPMREGAVASTNILALMLRHLVLKHTGRKNPSYIEFHTAFPRVMPNIKRRFLKQTLRLAGFREIEFYDSLLMGAIGAGMDIRSHTAKMVVDIGSETTGAAIFCNGGILFENTAPTGSKAAQRSLQSFFLEKYSLLIGAKTAETIKTNLDKDEFIIDGRSAATGFPERVSAGADELRQAAEHGLYNVFACIADTIKAVQPEAAADLMDNGITLIGGGAKQFPLAKTMENMFSLPVHTAPNAETAITDGLKECIFNNKKTYRELISESAEFASGE